MVEESNTEGIPHGLTDSRDLSSSMEVSHTTEAERHIGTQEETNVQFEYFTQPVEGNSSSEWKKWIETDLDSEILAVVDSENILGWAKMKQNGMLWHHDILTAMGKKDISDAKEYSNILLMPSKEPGIPRIEIRNLNSNVGLEALRPTLAYLQRSFRDLADKIKVDYTGHDINQGHGTISRPLSAL